MAVEPSPYPSIFHDLAEPDTLETVVAFVPNVVGCKAANHLFNTRDFRKRGICLGKRLDASVEPGYALNECNFATYTNISLIFYSIVLARNPVPSRSRREPLGEPILEEEASNEETRIRSVARTCHENKWETPKVDCRHLDKEKPEAIVHGKTPCTFEQEMA